jgi:hypothetical protein
MFQWNGTQIRRILRMSTDLIVATIFINLIPNLRLIVLNHDLQDFIDDLDFLFP